MKFKQFLNEAPILEPKFEKEFKNIGKKAKYKERYKEIFGDKDRIYLPYSDKFKNTYVKDEDNEYIIHALEDLEFSYSTVKKNKYFEKYLPKDLTSFRLDEVNIEDFDSINKKIEVFFDISYKSKHIKDKGSIRFTLNIPHKEFILLSNAEESRKKLLLKMIDANNILLDSKNNNKEMQIVISRNPCDIGSMSTGTWWKSCMNLYTGGYNQYTRKDVEHGTLIAYLILKGDKNIENPIGRVLIKPYKSKGKDAKYYLSVSDRTYGYFPDKAKKVVEEFIKEKQKDLEDIFLFQRSKFYNDDDVDVIYTITLNKYGLKVGDRIIFKNNNKEYTGKIVYENKEDNFFEIEFDKMWNELSRYLHSKISPKRYRIYLDRANYRNIMKNLKKEPKNEI